MDEQTNHNGKKECSQCKNYFRHLTYNPVKNTLVCKRCNKKIGTNKWFVPKEQRHKITRYNLSDDERLALHTQLMSMGYSSERAWKKINSDCKYLRNLRWRNRMSYWNVINKRKEEQKKMEIDKKKFIGGLKEFERRNYE